MRRSLVLLAAVLTATLTAALIARASAASASPQFRTPDAGAACRFEGAALVCSSIGSAGSVALSPQGAPRIVSRLPWWDAATPVLHSFHHGNISCRLAGAARRRRGAAGGDGRRVPRGRADRGGGIPNNLIYLAYVDGRPVARGSAAFGERGVTLFGGSTLPEARGRGAYRAVVAARWEDAVARGTPLLVTQAGPMSRPILGRLGFREVCEIRILVDRFGDGA